MSHAYPLNQNPESARRGRRLLAALLAGLMMCSAAAPVAQADVADDGVSAAIARSQQRSPVEVAPRFLFTLETPAGLAEPLPLNSNEAALLMAAGDDSTPALVPLAPPVWAGLAILGGMALVRTRQRRRYRV